jgi:hypothetical protein
LAPPRRSWAAKGDRADIRPLGTECGEKAWPYFDAACTRDGRLPLAQPRDVRMIGADRAADLAALR